VKGTFKLDLDYTEKGRHSAFNNATLYVFYIYFHRYKIIIRGVKVVQDNENRGAWQTLLAE